MDCSAWEIPLPEMAGDRDYLFAGKGGAGLDDSISDTASLSLMGDDSSITEGGFGGQKSRRGSLELMISRGSLSISNMNHSWREHEGFIATDVIAEEEDLMQDYTPLHKFVDDRVATFFSNINFAQEQAKLFTNSFAKKLSFASNQKDPTVEKEAEVEEDPDATDGTMDESNNSIQEFVQARRKTFANNVDFVKRKSQMWIESMDMSASDAGTSTRR